MDLNLLRSLVTVVAFVMFAGVLWWACGRARRSEFEEAARLPFETASEGRASNTPESQR